MLIARLLYPIRTLGPGERIGLWTQGCRRRCEGCMSPELQPFDSAKEIPAGQIARMIAGIARERGADGLTVSGGEPFEQAEDLRDLLAALEEDIADVLVFTGYTLPELRARGDRATQEALGRIDCLIDGPYLPSRNRGARLRGSDNQCIHLLGERNRERYLLHIGQEGNPIENFAAQGGAISVGIHKRDFALPCEGAARGRDDA